MVQVIPESRYVTIPTDPLTFVPVGISQSDFDLIAETLKLWQSKMVLPELTLTYTLAGSPGEVISDAELDRITKPQSTT